MNVTRPSFIYIYIDGGLWCECGFRELMYWKMIEVALIPLVVGLLACRPSFVCSGQFALSYYIGQSVHDVVMEILFHFLLKLINRGKEVVTERFE